MNRKATTAVLSFILAVAVAMAAPPAGALEVDEQQTDVSECYDLLVGEAGIQSFKVDQGTVHEIDFYIDVTNITYFAVYLDNDMNVDNGAIKQKTWWDVSGWDVGWHTWDIDGGADLDVDTTYYLVMAPEPLYDVYDQHWHVYGGPGNPYSRGQPYHILRDGSIIPIDDYDGAFRIYTEQDTEPNDPPTMSNPSPADGATGVDRDAPLSVDISDPNSDTVTVWFYNAIAGTTIGSDTVSGGSGTASVTWNGLDAASEYIWYATADDGTSVTTSSQWSFTTEGTGGNAVPELSDPQPPDGATDVNTSVEMAVTVSDADGDSVTVSFNDASDGSLLGTATVNGNGTASITWTADAGTEYRWFAVADDGTDSIRSDTWSFQTAGTPPVPSSSSDISLNQGMTLLAVGAAVVGGSVIVIKRRKG